MSYGGKNTFGTNLNCAYLQSAFKTCLVFYVFFFPQEGKNVPLGLDLLC